ncbi:MAG: DUF4097 domain-containing protein [Dehalococcoidia bacterium]|nr:DUF4097 domain-containing protein [Dehalococcoidia bacterium]
MKKWIVVLIILVVGVVLAGVGYIAGAETSFYIDKNGVHMYEKTPYTVNEPLPSFSDIDIDVDFASVEILRGESYTIDIAFCGDQETMPKYEVIGSTLLIKQEAENFPKRFHFGFDSLKNTLKIYVPQKSAFDNITVSNNFGDIKITNVAAGRISVNGDSGDIRINDVIANTIAIDNKFGDISLNNIDCDNVDVSTNSGSIRVDKLTATGIKLKNNFGDTNLKNIESVGLEVSSDAGDVNVSGSLSGHTQIENKLGDVKLNIVEKSDCYYNLSTRLGDIGFAGKTHGRQVEIGSPDAQTTVRISNSVGDIRIDYIT